MRDRREAARVIIIIGLVQGCLDLRPQLRRGADFLNRPVGQSGDPVDERESHCQHLDLPDHRKAGRQVYAAERK